MAIQYPSCQVDNADQSPDSTRMWLRQVATLANRLNQGKFNCSGTITLTASSATSLLTDVRLTIASIIIFSPTNAHSATEYASGNFYADYSTLTNGSITIKHTNNANADKIFKYIILG